METLQNNIFQTYDQLVDVIFDLSRIVSNLTCRIDPFFDSVDTLVDNYARCGFIGVHYGEFKRIACVDLFGDMYNISAGMMVIAYLSLIVVLFSLTMDYVVAPTTDEELSHVLYFLTLIIPISFYFYFYFFLCFSVFKKQNKRAYYTHKHI